METMDALVRISVRLSRFVLTQLHALTVLTSRFNHETSAEQKLRTDKNGF
jgi:hypothetical protein